MKISKSINWDQLIDVLTKNEPYTTHVMDECSKQEIKLNRRLTKKEIGVICKNVRQQTELDTLRELASSYVPDVSKLGY